jgi:hypothetical protein
VNCNIWFFLQNSQPQLQHKIYANDAWEPSDGLPFLASVHNVRSKLGFVEVFQSNQKKVAALHSFVSLRNYNWMDTVDLVPQKSSFKCINLRLWRQGHS